MVIFRKYNTSTASGTHIRIPIPKAGSTDFATGSDWTPASGDVKLSKDGGSQANIGTLPSFTNGAWEFQITGTELSCKQLEIMVVDSATKAIVDQAILIETFGNASAMYQADLSAAALAADVTKWSGTTVASPDTAGYPKVTVKSGTGTGEVSLSSGLVRLSATGVDDIWDEATSGHSTAGTTGKALTDAGSAGTPPTTAAIADAVWDEARSGHVASGSFGEGVLVQTNNDKTGYRLSATGVDDVWDEATSGHATSGTTGKALTDAGSAGTPPSAASIADAVWDEARSGHVASGSFGEGVIVSSLGTDAVSAAALATGAVNEIADGVMTRASSNWEASAPAKSLGTAVMKLTHKVDSTGGTMTTYRSDGSTPHVTQTETTDAAADPLTGLTGAS